MVGARLPLFARMGHGAVRGVSRVSVDVMSGMQHAKSLGFGQLGGISVARQCDSCVPFKVKFEQSPLHLSLPHGRNFVFPQQVRFEFDLIR